MDTLKNKNYANFDYISRYNNIPYYYDTLTGKQIYGIGTNVMLNTDYVTHKLHPNDTLNSLSLKYYKEARKLSEESLSSIGIAKSYIALEKEAKSKKLYEKLLKRYSNDCDLLIGALKVFPQRTEYYLSTVASLDINNVEVWLGLAKVAIHEKNFVMAETFLNNAYYIDDDNFKYYYYLSTLFQAKGDLTKSKESLKRCSRLNSDYVKNIDLE